MNLTAYDPWITLGNLHGELNRTIRSRLRGSEKETKSNLAKSKWTPAVDILEQTDCFVVALDVPGVPPEEIEITTKNGILTIKGERKEDRDLNENEFHRVERVSGSFYRRFSLPDSADPSRVSAQGKNGVLEIVIPKGEKAKARRIEVTATS